MSAFKKKGTTSPQTLPHGVLRSPYNGVPIISTGCASFDDLLGGGLPLGTGIQLEAGNGRTSFGTLLSKFFIAQGLDCGHDVIVIGSSRDAEATPEELVESLMGSYVSEAKGEEKISRSEMKIAFRYGELAQEKDVDFLDLSKYDGKNTFRSMYSLSGKRKLSDEDRARITLLDVSGQVDYTSLLDQIRKALMSKNRVCRIVLHNFASVAWGQSVMHEALSFSYELARLVQEKQAVAFSSLNGVLQETLVLRRRWILSDVVLKLDPFSEDPSAMAKFPRHSGLAHVISLPCSRSLIPASAKISTPLSGPSSPAMMFQGSLAFRVTKKQFVLESVRDDADLMGTENQASALNPVLAALKKDASERKNLPKKTTSNNATDVPQSPVPPGNTKKQRSGGVRFVDDVTVETKPVSLHTNPDLFEF